jgi:hypothetical protein
MRGDLVIKHGFRKGSQSERIDKAIGKTLMSIEEIARATEQERKRVRDHVEAWLECELFYEKGSDGRFRRRSGPHPGSAK